MKKVIFLSCTHHPLDDRIYYKEAIALKNNGFDVTHICFSSRSVKYTTKHGIEIFEIKRSKFLNVPVIGSLIWNFLFNFYLEEIIVEAIRQKADVYHFCDYQFIFLSRLFRKENKECRIIYDAFEPFHYFLIDYGSQQPFKRLLNKLYSKFLGHLEIICARKADHIIVTEETLFKRFKDKCEKVPVNIIHNYSNVIRPINIIENNNTKYDMMYAGLISRNRGLLETIYALNECKKSGESLNLLIVGPCYDLAFQKELNIAIDANNLKEHVEIPGNVKFEEMFYLYKQCKVGLIPFLKCKTHAQIMPTKLFEYLDMGMPVIATKFGSIGHFVVTNEVGEVTDPLRIKDFATSMINLLRNHSRFHRYEINAEKIRKNHFWMNEIPKLLNVYMD